MPGVSCYDAQFKCQLIAKTLKIWTLVEGSIPRAINNKPTDSKCSLKKCNLVNWENNSFALGKAAVPDEQQDKALATAWKSNIPQGSGRK